MGFGQYSYHTWRGLKLRAKFTSKLGNETRVPLSVNKVPAWPGCCLPSGGEHRLVDLLARPATGCTALAGFAGEVPAL